MIEFIFTGNPYPSLEEQKTVRENFLEKLGPYIEEFEKSGGFVVYNYTFPASDRRRMSFNVNENYDLKDFILRWNDYILNAG